MRKVYYNNLFAKLFLWGDFNTAMLFGFICTKKKTTLTKDTVQHESIHAEQYAAITAICFVAALILHFAVGGYLWFALVPFVYYIVYFVEAAISFIHHFFSTRKKDAAAAAEKAYYNSMFEMEAHEHDATPNYIQSRRWYYPFKYFGKV